jgi:hypothetical protein
MPEETLKILYLEDIPQVLDVWLKFLRDNWGEQCIGVRSREKAIQLIDDGFKPDLVIFDRGILYHEDDEVDNPGAGDSLYYYLWKRKICVAVFSGSDLEYQEPYASQPPLGFFKKPVHAEVLRSVIDLFLQSRLHDR